MENVSYNLDIYSFTENKAHLQHKYFNVLNSTVKGFKHGSRGVMIYQYITIQKIIMQSYSDCFHSNDFFNLTYDDVCWIQLADLHVTYINMFNVKMFVLYWFKEFSFNSFYRFNFVSTFLFLFSETFIQFLLFNTYRITI